MTLRTSLIKGPSNRHLKDNSFSLHSHPVIAYVSANIGLSCVFLHRYSSVFQVFVKKKLLGESRVEMCSGSLQTHHQINSHSSFYSNELPAC